MPADPQHEVIEFLSAPAAYGLASAPIERIDTHISIVWLAGTRAFKLKRAVRFDYVDFSTIELRRVACEHELRINRRTAPALYRGVRAITRQPDGSLAIDGPGQPIDWLVEMVRFDQETLFDRLAERGRLELALMGPLAEAVVRLHASACIRSGHGGRAGMTWVVDGNARSFREEAAPVLDRAAAAALIAETSAAIAQHACRLDARSRGGLVRECHGDLHLRNICLIDGVPTIFDGVEFNDEISCVDVLYDLAFLLMDLWRRDLRAHANVVFNEYLAATTDISALCLMPLFLSCRAAVRAKTNAASALVQTDGGRRTDLEAGAREYLGLAQRLLRPSPPRLVAIGGFSGSGKSTLARALAPDLGAVPGALIVRSDDVRKRMLGVHPLTRLGRDGYSPAATRAVYRTINDRVLAALEAGHAVIADAVFADAGARDAIRDVAIRAGVPFTGVWIDVPGEVLARRVADRTLDISDATLDVLVDQLRSGAGSPQWRHLDGAPAFDQVLAQSRSILAESA
jgi:aminoglycoside phosphotransferase family enzyme/predicted kinase